MARELSMNGRKKIERIQKEFTEKFNYLTLIFLDEDMKSIDVSRSLAEVRTAKGPDISIMASLKVNTLEQRFKDSFGITVEVAYFREGKVMHTKDSVNKTLNELNLWCEKNGCDKFLFKKALTRNTLLSTQEQLFNAIRERFPDAVAKKINKDNFMDVHLPSVNTKRGTHLFFNTAKDGIKFGFYCRDEQFNNPILERSSAIEAYAQGVRPKGNPLFANVEEAAEAAFGFIGELWGRFADNEDKSDLSADDKLKNNKQPDVYKSLDQFESMQVIELKSGYQKVMPVDFLARICQENEFIYLNDDKIGISYNMDISEMYGSPFGAGEEDYAKTLSIFEETFPKLKKLFSEEFEIFYFTYSGEYIANMWSFDGKKLKNASGWIGDFCNDCEDESERDSFVDQNYPLLKIGSPTSELLDGLRSRLVEV